MGKTAECRDSSSDSRPLASNSGFPPESSFRLGWITLPRIWGEDLLPDGPAFWQNFNLCKETHYGGRVGVRLVESDNSVADCRGLPSHPCSEKLTDLQTHKNYETLSNVLDHDSTVFSRHRFAALAGAKRRSARLRPKARLHSQPGHR